MHTSHRQTVNMRASHRQTVDNLRQYCAADLNMLALIIIGSVARGDCGLDSDVDFCVVVTEDDYRRRQAENDFALTFAPGELVVTPCSGANGRVITMQYLRDLADHGSEPFRYSFVETLIELERDPAISDLVQACAVYPEHERAEKLMSFASQIPAHFSFLEFGHYSQTPYVLYETAVKIVLFGGRLLLTHNRMFYPGRKGLMRELAKSPDKPAGIIELANTLLREPSIDSARAFIDPVIAHTDWPQPPEGIGARFWHDSVAQWERGWVPLEEC